MVEDSPAGEEASTTTPLFTKIGFDGEVGLINDHSDNLRNGQGLFVFIV